jgi:hypothetical protein
MYDARQRAIPPCWLVNEEADLVAIDAFNHLRVPTDASDGWKRTEHLLIEGIQLCLHFTDMVDNFLVGSIGTEGKVIDDAAFRENRSQARVGSEGEIRVSQFSWQFW